MVNLNGKRKAHEKDDTFSRTLTNHIYSKKNFKIIFYYPTASCKTNLIFNTFKVL